jgi:histidinol-phosphate phosphatase family protein
LANDRNGHFAVFLDRDGVINRRRPDHVKSLAEFEFLPGAVEALATLHRSGIRTVVVTNQAVVGRGLLREHELALIHQWMRIAISVGGGHIEKIYACTHLPENGCACRKPGVQLFLRASSELGIHLRSSVMIGDAVTDVQAARAVGCLPILIAPDLVREPAGVPVVRSLAEAVARLPELGRQRKEAACL